MNGNNKLQIILLDYLLAFIGIIFIFPLLVILSLLIITIDKHTPFFIQHRVGKNKKNFKIIKLRTMHKSTKNQPAHLTNQNNITNLGSLLRKTKLDELPQLINVLKGEMSFVGPRPALPCERVNSLREKKGILDQRPGITSLAALEKVDMSRPHRVAQLDFLLKKNLNTCFYMVLILKTLTGKGIHDPAQKV